MPRCQNCNKKCGIPMTCTMCKMDTCTRCRHLETHKCAGLETKNTKDLNNLEKKLEYSVKKQNGMLCP